MADEPETVEIHLAHPDPGSPFEGGSADLKPLDQHSAAWLAVVTPFANRIFTMVLGIVFVPLIALYLVPGMQSEERAKSLVGWANTVFPPLVGFASAVVGYLFGTRSQNGQK